MFKRRLEILRDEFQDVFVYTQEGLKNEFSAFLNGISRFLGADAPSVDDVDQTGRNIGLKTDFRVSLLRRLNQLDHRLERVPLAPTLHNRIFQFFNLTPRAFCQKKLMGKGEEKYTLIEEIEEDLRQRFAEDWAYIQSELSKQQEALSE